MKTIIGHTGLVGTTLCESIDFDYKFNSKNINSFSNCDLNGTDLYLTCLPAEKWKVNEDPVKDLQNIYSIIEFLKTKYYNKIILISTIDVYLNSSVGSTELDLPTLIEPNYGSNRYLFELLVKSELNYKDIKIYRLPALFNKHIKKNILFDLLHGNRVEFINANTTFQWYNLDKLQTDIEKGCQQQSVSLFNLFTEPLHTLEILEVFPKFKNVVNKNSDEFIYDHKTIHHDSGYVSTSSEVLIDIERFVNEFGDK